MAQENYVGPSILASSAAFSDLQNGGLAGILAKVIAANPAFADPASQATVSVTGGGSTGGLLPAGNYFVSYTYRDGAGESKVGTSRSGSFTVASGNKPRVTFNDTPPTGAVWRDVYLTAAGGAAGSETLYITGIPVATTTVDLLYAGPTQAGVPIPTANTTGAANIARRLNVAVGGSLNLNLLWGRLSALVSQYIDGHPVAFQDTRDYLRHLDYCFALWKQVTKEIITLIAANPGTLGYAGGATVPKYRRTFP